MRTPNLSACSYIDPTIVPTRGVERRMLELARQRGLSLHRLHRDGNVIRVSGPGVYIVCDGLQSLSPQDLNLIF